MNRLQIARRNSRLAAVADEPARDIGDAPGSTGDPTAGARSGSASRDRLAATIDFVTSRGAVAGLPFAARAAANDDRARSTKPDDLDARVALSGVGIFRDAASSQSRPKSERKSTIKGGATASPVPEAKPLLLAWPPLPPLVEPTRPAEADALLTVSAVAMRSDVCTKTIYAEIRDGNLRAQRVRHQWRISEDEIARYLAASISPLRIHPAKRLPATPQKAVVGTG